MPVIHSQLDPHSPQFLQNREAMLAGLAQIRQLEQNLLAKAAEAKAKFEKRGQLLPRERLNLLLDPGAPFLELASLAGYKLHDDKDGSQAGGGLIAGIGYVSGVRVLVVANNSAIKGGTISPSGLKKSLRLQQIAMENKLPVVTLAESGGANLNYAAEIFVEGARSFANQARMSAMGLPQITVVHGSATAGGAYQPGLSDYVVVVRGKAKLFLAGPPLLKAATGEVATDEELGGAEMHAQVAGTAEYLAENDGDGVRIVREILDALPWNARLPLQPTRAYAEPLYPIDELLGLIPDDPKKPYDAREIVARIADGSNFLEFKGEFDQQTLCGHLQIQGRPCGFIGNNGPITPKGASKAAQFIQLCDQSGTPLLFFHNTTGFMVGTESEQQGVIKHGSKLIQAVANARVPKLTIVVGGSYGAGNYAMCGRGLDPRFIFAWPNSRTAVMGGAQAGKVLRIVTEAKHAKQGQAADPQMLDMLEQVTAQKLDSQSTALYGSANLWDDGLIDPRDTRTLLGYLLDICHEAQVRQLQPNSFGVARF
ncbi:MULTISPECIES: geranyl-CoA carboxylase subunit beta [Pseudomonas]|uniref:Geranyl-CoA carboxylase carboxyl transferase subunit n=1 Tax=Pseudomonas chlororaphis subsp. aureofaciens TaxID=587851 RepID=A0AAD0ZFM6_9PSED|nr:MULTISPECIES: geranyl-CoA carboxylase subunit beta [Pseudomonas]AIC21345.1 acetyl-CoA carboxylase [Pseudomonas chlororaphis]AZE24879.1 Geranyl-CoA carboxylase carboxyl transferase subunit [Pseudomonas chlororaphis subsp. aureofaciens]AZE31076.1 Geranyl-CoA carboxylase carboxyl transferase subunit [Pseudomonas chlororaphis subsp. aureofaciens]AZE37391.1 Geranyl-CoA carboxylase carboxyl transferase subunit [Pseudomonas chlororaphis subsp. aureofaciens]AZE43789.1 Geranyl-CoA carboxylase carbox